MAESWTVLVLGGGPDRERPVSLKSAACVAEALRKAGHTVLESDVMPDELGALEGRFDVVFPVLHGRWGEGGPLQKILDARGLRYVGCREQAAKLAMDKALSKQVAEQVGVRTAPYQMLKRGVPLLLKAPLVLKPINEGSSFGVEICKQEELVPAARARLEKDFDRLMAEQYVDGREVAVGVLDGRPLPPILIVPAAEFYDFQAKYDRNDTRYDFDLGLPTDQVRKLQSDAVKIYDGVGARHLSRVDFILDQQNVPWFLEINTLPGFTDHSLFPKAAERTGLPMPALCDKLVRLAMA